MTKPCVRPSAALCTHIVGELPLDERVVGLAEVELRLLPRRVGRNDQCEPPRGLVRPGGEGGVKAELADERRHVTGKEDILDESSSL